MLIGDLNLNKAIKKEFVANTRRRCKFIIASRSKPSFNSSNSNGSQNTKCSVDFCLHEIPSLKKEIRTL